MRKTLLMSCSLMFALVQIAMAQSVSVRGRILDEKGGPVVSASIQVRNTNTGVSTDSAGAFRLNMRPNSIILVSAVGYQDTAINISSQIELSIVLRSAVKSLKEAVVNAPSANGGTSKQMETMNNQAIQNTVSNYRESQNLYTGQNITSSLGKGNSVVQTLGTAPTGMLYTGASLPVFTHKEETRGNRYFFDRWVSGSVIDTAGNLYAKPSFMFNYDKISKVLLLTEDQQRVIELDKNNLKKFTLQGDNGSTYVFEKIPAINPDNLYIQLVKRLDKYSLYKLLKTKFVKSDYHTDGIVESGNLYDEYVDESEYYLTLAGDKEFRIINFKKKFIKEVLATDSAKVNMYFSRHSEDPIDEAFLIGLVKYLNQ